MRRPRSLKVNVLVLGTCLIAWMMYSNWAAFVRSFVPVNEPQISTIQNKKFSVVQHDAFPQSSSAHCSLSTMNELAWKFNQCSFQNLCYFNHKFEFYQLLADIIPVPEPLTMSGRHANNEEHFVPVIKPNQRLPTPRFQPANANDVWVMVGKVDQSNGLERFLRDGVFAWWLLGQHAVWDGGDNAVLRPIAVGPTKLTPQHQEWFQAVFPEAGRLITTENDLNELNVPLCFPRSVAGLGAMTDHCHAPEDHELHEQKVMQMHIAAESIPCSTGRGALFFELRELILTNLKLFPSPSDPKFILLAEEFAHLAERIAAELQVEVKVQQQQGALSHTAKLFLNAAVFVTRSFGDHTVGAMFMPPGAGLVLVQQKPTYTNFAYWNNLAYLRPAWTNDDDDGVMKQIGKEWERSKKLINPL